MSTTTPTIPSQPFLSSSTIQIGLACFAIVLCVVGLVFGVWKVMCFILGYIDERTVDRQLSLMEQAESTYPKCVSLCPPDLAVIIKKVQTVRSVQRPIPLPLHAIPALPNYSPYPIYFGPSSSHADLVSASPPARIQHPTRPPPIASEHHPNPHHPRLRPALPKPNVPLPPLLAPPKPKIPFPALPKPNMPLPPLPPDPTDWVTKALLEGKPLMEAYAEQKLLLADKSLGCNHITAKNTRHALKTLNVTTGSRPIKLPKRSFRTPVADKENTPLTPLKLRRT